MSKKQDKVNWSFDYKKIRILHYLLAHGDGGIKTTFLNLKTERPFGTISSKDIENILKELEWDDLITKIEHTPTNSIIFKVTDKGKEFVQALKDVAEKYSCKFYLIDAIKEPTDAATSRNDSFVSQPRRNFGVRGARSRR